MKNLIKAAIFLVFLGIFTEGKAQYRYGSRVIGLSREYNTYPGSWCAAHILGMPNVYPQYGDIEGTWTPEDYGDQRDTIIVGFDNSSPIDSILIWETNAQGFVDSVFVKNPNTNAWVLVFSRKPLKIPNGADTLANILRIGFPMTTFNVDQVRIFCATDSANDYVEIDAVAIHPKVLSQMPLSSTAGTSVKFDGIDDYYRTNFSALEVTKQNNFTAMCWVKITADTAPKVNYPSYGAGILTHSENYFAMSLANTGGGDSIYVYVDDDDYSEIAIAVNKNNWQHIAMVNNKDSLKVYVNGQLMRTMHGSAMDTEYAGGFIEFGRHADYLSFKGEIDEVKLFNRALTPAEIAKQFYTIGDGAKINNLVGYWQFNEGTDSVHINPFSHLTDSLHNGASYTTSGTILSVRGTNLTGNSIYPNPNKGVFEVTIPKEFIGLSILVITDINGREVYNTTTGSNNVRIELPNLTSGIYTVSIRNQQHSLVNRFVVD